MAGDKTKPAAVFACEIESGLFMCNTVDMIASLRWLADNLESGQEAFGTMYIALRADGFHVSGVAETPIEIDAKRSSEIN